MATLTASFTRTSSKSYGKRLTSRYKAQVQQCKVESEQDLSELYNAIVAEYTEHMFPGYSTSKEVRYVASQVNPTRIVELVVAKHFGVCLPPAGVNLPGYDLDSQTRKYGKIEVRSRSFRLTPNGQGYEYYTAVLLGSKDLGNYGRKTDKFDWLFACCWNPVKGKLVWFRIPYSAIPNKALTIQISKKDGGYGKWDKYKWDGPS